VANKTVYPVPGIHLPGIKSEEQSVDETWAAELVASGAFRYTDISDEAKQSLVDQEVKRVLDAQQSNAEISLAKMEEKLAKTDKLPAEAVFVPSPGPDTDTARVLAQRHGGALTGTSVNGGQSTP
jgi:hypothetical protein